MSRAEEIFGWCRAGELPEGELLYGLLTEESGAFVDIEGPCWDFKDEWPFSLSNDYFGGICRLICAFANSGGGLIVFGVDDAKRTGGHNRVKPNVDKFMQAFRQLTGSTIAFDLRHYPDNSRGDVLVLLVGPRGAGEAPIRFQKKLGPYQANVLWVRSGHEVVPAGPQHFPTLFCRSNPGEIVPERDGSIPPSPATMKRFVGRVEVLDRLFGWLESSDEPRTYLHGKGGSGKTTIAYEFARLVKDFGENLRLERCEPIDAVVFLSAKERELVPATGKIAALSEPDFADERSLLAQILYHGAWTRDHAYLDGLSLDGLRQEIRQYFDLTSALVVLDDVDTLTTRGVDPGSDFLYRTLCRSQKRSKVLYTLRNAPSQSLLSSIEVPGLEGADYETFVSECAKQFRVKEPTKEFRDTLLPELSERRPLVIESIIALVRTASTYERAAELFSQHAGDNVRDYVFIREWDALAGDNPARLMLAALADLNRPATFQDLQTVTQMEDSSVRDAIGRVREMFLQVDEAGQEVLFSLAPLTRRFIDSRKKTLQGYARITERVSTFKRNIRITSPDVLALVTRVQRLLPLRDASHHPDRVRDAWRLVSDSTLSPRVTEDPVFKSAYGYVCSHMVPPKLTEAREAFNYVHSMRHEPLFGEMRSWFAAEKSSGVMDGWCEKIAERVIGGRSYSEVEKIGMLSRKATSIFARARERLYTDPTDAQKDLGEALALHLRAFRLNCLRGDMRTDVSEEYARNTARMWFDLAFRSEQPWELFDRVRHLLSLSDTFLDPIERPLVEFVSRFDRAPMRVEIIQRTRNKLKGLTDMLGQREQWLDAGVSRRLQEVIQHLDEGLERRAKGGKSGPRA